MAIEIDIRIIAESTQQVVQELTAFASHLSGGLGVVPHAPNSEPATPESPPGAKANGAEAAAPAKIRGKKATPAPEPEPEKARLDRAAIIEGLTKIYSKGDEDVRLAITKFRDGQGADRLRDLKDDALPAAAELLTELKLSAESPAV